jgi:hypothetical protein
MNNVEAEPLISLLSLTLVHLVIPALSRAAS